MDRIARIRRDLIRVKVVMDSLVIFFIHGAKGDLKIVSKPTIAHPNIITITVFYSVNPEDPLEISGSPIITQWLTDKEQWLNPTFPDHRLNLFEQLYTKTKAYYGFKSTQISVVIEGNLGTRNGPILATPAVQVLNYTQPGNAILPTGSSTCCKFINYWREYYQLPQLELSENFIFEHEHYSASELTDEKVAELNQQMTTLALSFSPLPHIATFDKPHVVSCIKFLFGIVSVAGSPVPHIEPYERRLSPIEDLNEHENYIFTGVEPQIFSEQVSKRLRIASKEDPPFSETIDPHEDPISSSASKENPGGMPFSASQSSSPLTGIPEIFNPASEKYLFRANVAVHVAQTSTTVHATIKKPFRWSMWRCCGGADTVIPMNTNVHEGDEQKVTQKIK